MYTIWHTRTYTHSGRLDIDEQLDTEKLDIEEGLDIEEHCYSMSCSSVSNCVNSKVETMTGLFKYLFVAPAKTNML